MYGADEAGAETVGLLLSDGHGLLPVAIVDLREEYGGLRLHGVRVVAGEEELRALHERGTISGLVIPDHGVAQDERNAVEEACRAMGVPFSTVSVSSLSQFGE